MSEIIQRNTIFVLPCPDGEELHYYGIKKFVKEWKITTLKQTFSPEGGEWTFLYDGRLNRLYIEKDGNIFKFTGGVSGELIEDLRKVFNMREKLSGEE